MWFVRPISNVCVWTPNPNGRGFCFKKKEEAWLTGSNQPPSGDCTNFLLLNVSAILLIAPSFPIGFNIGCRKMRQRNQTKDTWFVSSRIRYNLSYCRSDWTIYDRHIRTRFYKEKLSKSLLIKLTSTKQGYLQGALEINEDDNFTPFENKDSKSIYHWTKSMYLKNFEL